MKYRAIIQGQLVYDSDEKKVTNHGIFTWVPSAKLYALVPGTTEIHRFTGNFDRNGKEVWEQDTVIINHKGGKQRAKIIWHEPAGMFCYLWPDGYINVYPIDYKNIETIGYNGL